VVHVAPDEYLFPLAGRLQPWPRQLADRYDGKVYLDALSGIAVNTLGHNHPALVAAIAAQAGRLLHSSNLYRIPQQEQLADKLAALSGMDEIFFCNSGCEANEAAIKLARLRSPAGRRAIRRRSSWKRLSTAAPWRRFQRPATARRRRVSSRWCRALCAFPTTISKRFGRLPGTTNNIVAVMLEIVQGEGGINIADIDFQRGLRALCDDRDWLLICDEVQCGMGRTGHLVCASSTRVFGRTW
jgi:acetylornithine/N-succinyldiaminopimelate aminotransferase